MARRGVAGVKLRNLTPHEVVVRDHDDRPVTLPPEGIVPRREVVRRDGGTITVAGTDHGEWAPTMAPDATLHVTVEALGPVAGLPDPVPGVALVVSRLVAEAVPDRRDVFAPGELIRDSAGRIVGARGLCRVATMQDIEAADAVTAQFAGPGGNCVSCGWELSTHTPTADGGWRCNS